MSEKSEHSVAMSVSDIQKGKIILALKIPWLFSLKTHRNILMNILAAIASDKNNKCHKNYQKEKIEICRDGGLNLHSQNFGTVVHDHTTVLARL